ncbi:type II toxin-antitoxin system VapB family antitoxin [Ornithinimicrobium sp. F0845]|uniref:type II toxin-antitoxin system VapB family antitoxin n=1 Tax=Ornithinimicrobium sp. F0845 TaxID=2926412 RepID=UPI001FF5B7D7|nr:type II toxin-antitoxin system VapB family antitoxin [Ornithinimicrobium sp. F0845]MCK0112016.1 type II toxin-antitoxin system VapB family antitoxin [Ornithinimicrobium sp. F0845]
MGLNIKNQRVHDLAREAARTTGKTQTGAIEEALELLLRHRGVDPDERSREQTMDQVRAIASEYSTDPGREDRVIRRVEDLFDESGLPR